MDDHGTDRTTRLGDIVTELVNLTAQYTDPAIQEDIRSSARYLNRVIARCQAKQAQEVEDDH